MRQRAKVEALEPGGSARLLVLRQSACSGDCHRCSGCGAVEQRLYLSARNPIGAQVGDRVIVESGSATVLWAAVLVYLLPLGLFVAGYLAALPLGGWAAAVGCLGLCLGILPALAYNQRIRKKPPVYTVVSFSE